MNTIRSLVLLLLLATSHRPVAAQDSIATRLAFSTSVGQLAQGSLPTGWSVRQQIAYFPTRRVGVALGLSWGSLEQPLTDPSNEAQLRQFFIRDINTTDLGITVRLLDSRRHTLALQGGGALLRTKNYAADSVFFNASRNATVARFRATEGRTVVPTVGATYQFRFWPRFSAGIDGRWLWVDGELIRTVGLVATYRFNVSAASLGFSPVAVDELTWGVRAGLNLSSSYERSPNSIWVAGPLAGFWAEMPLGLNWQVRCEFSYVARGSQKNESRQGSITQGGFYERSHYLDATLLFRTELTPTWHLFLGPNLGFLLNGKYTSGNQTYPTESGINSGLVLGTSVAFGRISVDARYVRDVIKFSSEPYDGYQGFQFGTSVRMGRL